MPERIALVTGAHGFIGRHAARAFAASGFTVVGVGHGAWSDQDWRSWGVAVWYASDITLDALLACGGAPEAIVHCGGSASVPFSVSHPLEDFGRTVDSTLAVLEFARLRDRKPRVVMVSTGSVYGAVEGVATESAPASPQSPYACHKLVAETLCREYALFFGVPSTIVRLFSVHGPGLRKQLLWDACGKLSRHEARFAGTGRERRDWLHVDDAVALLVMAAEHACSGVPVVNGGTGVGATVSEVIGELSRAMGSADAIEFTGEHRPGDPAGFVADISLARSWGWEPRVDWRDGVRRYADWFRSLQDDMTSGEFVEPTNGT